MKAVLPKHLCDVEAIELVYGPPDTILTAAHLRPYQLWMAELVRNLPGVFLGAEMGLGKTVSTLYAFRGLLDAGEIKHLLIIAPLRVSEETWPAEIAKWDFARDMTYTVVTGTAEERVAALAERTDITIVNRENLTWLYDHLGMRGWYFDMIAYDEASRLKAGNLKSKPTKRKDGSKSTPKKTELGVLNRVRTHTKRIVELSGTPSPNGLIDLWGPFFAIDGGQRLGHNITAFRDRWFRLNPYKRTWEPMDHAYGQIMARLKDVFFSLREEDYLTLPPMIEVDHKVELGPKVMKRYKEFEKESAIELRNRAGEEEVVEAVNGGVLTGKLLQFANGSIYLGDKFDEEEEGRKLPKESVRIHDKKLDALESIMEEAGGAPVLVAYSFQFDKEAIKKRFPYVRIFGEDPNDVRDWNAGKIRMLLTHPASAGHGLNFQYGSNIAVWYGLTWSLELYRQFIKRLHRSGQKADKVYLHRIIAAGTIDESVLPLLVKRGVTQDHITDAVRVRLARAA